MTFNALVVRLRGTNPVGHFLIKILCLYVTFLIFKEIYKNSFTILYPNLVIIFYYVYHKSYKLNIHLRL